jgi:hypothetical protein
MQKHFRLHSSYILTALLLLIHVLALASVLRLPVPAWGKWATAISLLASLIYYLRRNAWRSLSTSWVAFRLEKTHVVLIARNGQELAGQLLSDSVVMPFMTLLRILPHGARFARSVVIFPDAIAPESFRQLRVLLRWGQ